MMKLYKNFDISKNHKRSIILIGNFDGVHLGHQRLFKLANSYKKIFKLNIGVVTFEPMPKMYFNKKIKNFRISNISQKNKILNSLGIELNLPTPGETEDETTIKEADNEALLLPIKDLQRAEMRIYADRRRAVTSNLTALWGVIIGQCTPALQEELRAEESYDE